MEGNAFKLARWFQPERYANRPEDDFLREEILGELHVNADARAEAPDGTVLFRTSEGACMVERFDYKGSPMVNFDYVSNTRWTRTAFWMNASSVEPLLGRLAELPKVEFDALFVGAAT